MPVPDPTPTHVPPRGLATRPWLLKGVLTLIAMLLVFAAISYQRPVAEGGNPAVVDFHAFHVAGTLGLQGRAADGYDARKMARAQKAATGVKVFMPWTYPPPFTLFVTGLAALPLGLAYGLFTGLTLALYVTVLRRIAGPFLPGVILAMIPIIVLTVMTGQNGFLTGALTGWFLLALLAQRSGAGVPLGLMVIKPHLAAGLALLALAHRRWQTVAIAAVTVAAALLAATIAFGPSIWIAFIDGVRESGMFLSEGRYPMYRMISPYASAFRFGAEPGLAFAIQGAGAVIALGLLLIGWYRALPPRWLAASACAATVFVSPYAYDYDLCLLGVALALILPDLLARTRPWEQAALLVLCWVATGFGFVASYLPDGSAPAMNGQTLPLMAPLVVTLIAWVAVAMRRSIADAGIPAPSVDKQSRLLVS
ncbi:MAG: glycosyltransferase family 87 protein [Pseudomonadota bacterium]